MLEHRTWIFLAAIIDFLFFIDILISFRTTQVDLLTGIEIRDTKQLAHLYFQGQFTIDFLSTVPFDTFAELILGDAGFFKVLGVLKLVRVMRLSRIITFLRCDSQTKAMLNLFKLVFYLIMYVHCCGCVFWLLINPTERWIPVYQYGKTYLWGAIYHQSTEYQYIACVHSAMLSMTGNETGPRTTV
jgi:potassium voltage-gated channel Eag-related subfamily H protein 7